jgi:hypothetical protein
MTRLLRSLLVVFVVAVFLSANTLIPVFAATAPASDMESIDLDTVHYRTDYVDNYTCSAAPGVPLAVTGPVYILGDSLVNGARGVIERSFADNGLSIASINADPGRAISLDTAGNNPSGLQAVTNDTAIIASAGAVVVSLGTNSGTEELNTQIPALIGAIRNISANVNIYWVNMFYTAGSRADRNTIIESQSQTLNFAVIDAEGAGIELGADGVHPTTAGNTTFANLITTSLGSGTPPDTVPGATYNPMSLSFPNFPDEALIGTAITNYIRNRAPSSPFLTIPVIGSTIGNWIVTESKARDINPLFVVGAGKIENNFGTVGAAATNNNNYFGMTDGRGGYRSFPTPQAGITAFMDAINNNIYGNGAGGRYRAATNIYEYFSIHQSGVIAYPGDNLDPNDVSGPGGAPDGNRADGFDPIMDVYISWTRTDHPNNRHDGNLYNPLVYYRSNVEVVNAITGLALPSDDPRAIASSFGGSCVDSITTGNVSIDGYAFPLAPQTRAVGGIRVGQTTTGHWDLTDAYDLTSTDSADVYAIFGGTPVTIGRNYHGVPGCSSIQFLADDGFYYWYGHLKNVVVQEDVHIPAGTRMAEIADDTNFTGTCWGGGPHLHIDRGCTIAGVPQRGGADACRDPNFIPFLSRIYESLP